MKRLLTTLVLSLIFLPMLHAMMQGAGIHSIHPIHSTEYELQVDLWTDKSEGSVYRIGSNVGIYFRVSGDCFLTLYDIDTQGRVSIVFPRYPDDGFVYGGVTYRLPDYYAGLQLRVSGPTGIEYLHAVAAIEPYSFRYRDQRGEYRLFVDPVHGDPFLAINRINASFIYDSEIAATATTSFFVGAEVWYPRYLCADCHADVRYTRDPYSSSCTQFIVRTSREYDYWWKYGYHPGHRNHIFAGAFWHCLPRPVPVHRHFSHRYLVCAGGHSNYVPVATPRRPQSLVKYRNQVSRGQQGYTRGYTTVRYSDTYTRRSGASRSDAERRTPDFRTEQDRGSAEYKLRTQDRVRSLDSRDPQERTGGDVNTSGARSSRSRSVYVDTDSENSRGLQARDPGFGRNSARMDGTSLPQVDMTPTERSRARVSETDGSTVGRAEASRVTPVREGLVRDADKNNGAPSRGALRNTAGRAGAPVISDRTENSASTRQRESSRVEVQRSPTSSTDRTIRTQGDENTGMLRSRGR